MIGKHRQTEKETSSVVPDYISTRFTGVSVVVPTHGRAHLVRQLLASLSEARQSTTVPCEVIIVDSSGPSEAEQIAVACASNAASYVRHEENNVRRKRNWGIETARYDIVLFIDSDCRASNTLILEHLEGHSEGGKTRGVMGVTRFSGEESWIWPIVRHSGIAAPFSYPDRFEEVPWAPTCNVSYRRHTLVDLGGFDDSLPFALGGDDTDLGLRVSGHGYRIACRANALVEHTTETWNSVSLVLRRVVRWGRMHFHIMRKHPDRFAPSTPRPMGLLVLIIVLGLFASLVTGTFWPLFAAILWLTFRFALEVVLLCLLPGHALRRIHLEAGARFLTLAFEFGTLFEGLKNGSLAPAYRASNYAPPSVERGRREAIAEWASLGALLLLVGVF